jgi:IrrE N-terminal-like domain
MHALLGGVALATDTETATSGDLLFAARMLLALQRPIGHDDARHRVAGGGVRSGRRRMTLAHELGHWLCGDAYDGSPGDDHEKMIMSFAIHFLAPRAGVVKVWNEHSEWSTRDRALAVGAKFRLSWKAAVVS